MLQFFWRHLRRDQRGFTLIELLIVVAIIAILAAILIPNFLKARLQARISATKGNMKNIGTSLESYFVDQNAYPAAASWETDLINGDYIRAVPTKPGGGNYTYDDNSVTGQDYWVCDSTTDPAGAWYYTPGAGLPLVVQAACPGALP